MPIEKVYFEDRSEVLEKLGHFLDAGPGTDLAGFFHRRRHLDRGHYLCRQGDDGAEVHILLSGSLKAERISPTGEATVIRFYFPGDFVFAGNMPGGAAANSVVTLEPSSFVSIPFAALQRLMRADEGIASQCFRRLSRHVCEEQRFLSVLANGKSLDRVAYFLYHLAQTDTSGLRGTGGIRLPMTRGDIARHLGLSVETVSRTMTLLKVRGVISMRGRQFVVEDFEGLERLGTGEMRHVPPPLVRRASDASSSRT